MRRLRLIVVSLAASLAVVAVGCRERAADPEEPPIDVPEADLKALADGNNQFAIELYQKLAETHDGNLVVSPYSISSALAMTYAGARGETAEQMRKTLHFTLPPDRLHPAFGGTTRWLQSGGKKRPYELSIANALWAQQGLGFMPEFLDLTGRSYGAGLREVDFAGDREAARGTINRWVEEQTQDKIKDLLKPEDLDPMTRLVLTNAIYFRGTWKHQFDKGRTYDGEFEVAPRNRVKVPMMRHEKIKLRTCKTETWQLLELPYAGERLAMVVLLPVKRRGLREVEARLTTAELQHGLSQLSEQEIDVHLPRFQFKSRFELKEPLLSMGMRLPFSGAADFSGITPGGGLRLKEVIHGGSVEVDEVGTVAAAATAVPKFISLTPQFRAEYPFLFLIHDGATGNILFMARVADPR